jgi:hypothetical protein
MYYLSYTEAEQWIEEYIQRETAVARKRVETAEPAVQQEQEDTMLAEITGLMKWQPKKTFNKMKVPVGDSLSDLASSEEWVDGEDQDDEKTEQGKLSEDDEPGWALSTFIKTVQLHMVRFRQAHIKLDELIRPGCENAADCIWETD